MAGLCERFAPSVVLAACTHRALPDLPPADTASHRLAASHHAAPLHPPTPTLVLMGSCGQRGNERSAGLARAPGHPLASGGFVDGIPCCQLAAGRIGLELELAGLARRGPHPSAAGRVNGVFFVPNAPIGRDARAPGDPRPGLRRRPRGEIGFAWAAPTLGRLRHAIVFTREALSGRRPSATLPW